jgi:hypothetical protein
VSISPWAVGPARARRLPGCVVPQHRPGTSCPAPAACAPARTPSMRPGAQKGLQQAHASSPRPLDRTDQFCRLFQVRCEGITCLLGLGACGARALRLRHRLHPHAHCLLISACLPHTDDHLYPTSRCASCAATSSCCSRVCTSGSIRCRRPCPCQSRLKATPVLYRNICHSLFARAFVYACVCVCVCVCEHACGPLGGRAAFARVRASGRRRQRVLRIRYGALCSRRSAAAGPLSLPTIR